MMVMVSMVAFAILLLVTSITGQEVACEPRDTWSWTPWFNFHRPSLKGEYELHAAIRSRHPTIVCAEPHGVSAVNQAGVDMNRTLDMILVRAHDVFCLNSYDPKFQRKICDDYSVRYCCPTIKQMPALYPAPPTMRAPVTVLTPVPYQPPMQAYPPASPPAPYSPSQPAPYQPSYVPASPPVPAYAPPSQPAPAYAPASPAYLPASQPAPYQSSIPAYVPASPPVPAYYPASPSAPYQPPVPAYPPASPPVPYQPSVPAYFPVSPPVPYPPAVPAYVPASPSLPVAVPVSALAPTSAVTLANHLREILVTSHINRSTNALLDNQSRVVQLTCGRTARSTPYYSNMRNGFFLKFFNTMLSRIISGAESRPHGWPWLVSIGVRYRGANGMWQNRTHICGGTLIEHSHVLTAAHCLEQKIDDRFVPLTTTNPTLESFFVLRIGVHDIRLTRTDELYGARRLFVHERFISSTFENDIAIIRLDRPVTVNEQTTPICLPVNHVTPGTQVTVAGWGTIAETSRVHSDVLRQAPVHILPAASCRVYMDVHYDSSKQLCAAAPDWSKDTWSVAQASDERVSIGPRLSRSCLVLAIAAVH